MYFLLKLPLISFFLVKVCFHACFEVLGSALSSTLSLAENRLTLLWRGQAITNNNVPVVQNKISQGC